MKRDGFYNDVDQRCATINNRDRYFVRGQLLFEPIERLSIRLIADYTSATKNAARATYIDGSASTSALISGGPLERSRDATTSSACCAPRPAARGVHRGYSRDIYVTPGRSYGGTTKD